MPCNRALHQTLSSASSRSPAYPFVRLFPFTRRARFVSEQRASGMTYVSPGGSESFTPEQKEYLSGFFAGAIQRMAKPFAGVTPSGQITSDPASGVANLAEQVDTYHGTPLPDLSREERWKFEHNPLD